MKTIRHFVPAFLLFMLISKAGTAQSFDFENTVYYTATGNALTTSSQNLSLFDYSSALPSHALFNDGIYFPIVDYLGNNLWLRVRHIDNDPNGTGIGYNVNMTYGSPFRLTGFGGWFGFLYEFDIYSDVNLIGTRGDSLNTLYPTHIIVESIETLSQGEWVSFEIVNNINSWWVLHSINFTGLNPTSQPGFSAVNIPVGSNIPPTGFDTIFPAQSNSVYVVDYNGGSSYAEFRISATDVSQFKYGYEYYSSGGYQGMRMTFGSVPIAVEELNKDASVTLAPNPASGIVTVNTVLSNCNQIKIIDVSGKTVAIYNVKSFPTIINTSTLPNGIYTFQLNNGMEFTYSRLIVVH